MQVVKPPMDTIQEEPEVATEVTIPPPYGTSSQLNVNCTASPGSTSPVISPHSARKNKGGLGGGQGHGQGHLMNNLIGSLSGIRSTLNLSRGHLHETPTGNHNNKGGATINIGYVQGIDTSRANVNRLTNSSRDLHRGHHDNNNQCSGAASHSTPSTTARHLPAALLQTLHGTRTITHDNHYARCNSAESPVTDRPPSLHASRVRIDSLTSQTSLSVPGNHGNPRPRSHCFTVEPVDDSTLDTNTTTTAPTPTSSTGQNGVAQCGAGITNATFVIDMNNTATSDVQSDFINNAANNSSLHVAFNSVPQIITQPPPPEGVTTAATAELPGTNSLTAEVGLMEPLLEVATDQNSSTESLPYIKPDPNQCTVTSLTPLLPPDSSDSEPEVPPENDKPEIV